MVPAIRSAPAPNAPSGPGNQRSDSDLDDYELQDNPTSSRMPEFHLPLSDLDVALAENLIPGLGRQQWHSNQGKVLISPKIGTYFPHCISSISDVLARISTNTRPYFRTCIRGCISVF